MNYYTNYSTHDHLYIWIIILPTVHMTICIYGLLYYLQYTWPSECILLYCIFRYFHIYCFKLSTYICVTFRNDMCYRFIKIAYGQFNESYLRSWHSLYTWLSYLSLVTCLAGSTWWSRSSILTGRTLENTKYITYYL